MNWRPVVASTRNIGAERTWESWHSIRHGGEHEAVPAFGALCGSWLPLGCTQPPPGRVVVVPVVYVGVVVPVMRSTTYVALPLERCVTRYSVSSVAEIVTQGAVQKCEPDAWVTFVTLASEDTLYLVTH